MYHLLAVPFFCISNPKEVIDVHCQKPPSTLGPEMTEAMKVFLASLPAWSKIRITDGLGPLPFMDRPYTEELSSLGLFFVNLGPDMYPDATANQRYKDTLIHELTHVWQYDRVCLKAIEIRKSLASNSLPVSSPLLLGQGGTVVDEDLSRFCCQNHDCPDHGQRASAT